MHAEVREKIYIVDPTPAMLEWCRIYLIVSNPDYEKKARMGLWTGNIPRQFQLYEKTDKYIAIPFGCLHKIHEAFPEMPMRSRIRPLERVEYDSRINLYGYQENAVQAILAAKNGILVMPCGAGKGLPIDAKICTPTGWKRNGDLRIGDAVVGSDGKATRVTGIFDRGKVDAYKITFSDGVETVCDKDHLWTVQKQSQRAESGNWDVMNTQAIYEHYQSMKCRSQYLYIPIVKPVEFYGYEDYRSMNPWLLGFLLGDGCFQKSMITMSTNENDILDKVVNIIGKDYGACEWIVHKKNYDWRFCGGYTLHDIRSLGLECKHSYEKFIPKEYLFAPVEVRLAVLQGLFDADGHISNGTIYEYSTTSKQLADDVVFIVESLGGTAKVREKIPTYTYSREKRTGRKAYRIFFKLYNFEPFTSMKHAAAYRERTHYKEAYRIIKKIEPCESIISRCITVDAKDKLYVTEHFVVTHNTQTALETVARIGMKTLWLTHTQDLMMQSMLRAKAVLGIDGSSYGTITGGKVNIGRGITFATVQTMCKIDQAPYRDEWGCIITDECFPGGTLIDTSAGKKELKNLCIDDIITSYNVISGEIENKHVAHVFKNKAHDIVAVKLENGEKIVCTKNHPIFTRCGEWVTAERLTNDNYVLRLVWRASGSGRELSLFNGTAEAGSKKRAVLEWVRVDGVKVQKQTGDGTFGGLCSDGYVYNIEVADNNNYFANGILVHNCHHAVGSPTKAMQFYKVLSSLSCRYKIGLTATPKRADGMERTMYALLGDVAHEVTKEEVAHTTCPVEVVRIETGYQPNVDVVLCGDGTISYANLVRDLTENRERFEVVRDTVEECAKKGSVLVLASRVDYLQRLNDAFSGKSRCLSGAGNSKAAKEERKSALKALNDGEIDCLFASYQLAKEGLDVPGLRYVVFSTPEKDPTTVVQSAGRVARRCEGKDHGTVVDLVDDFGMYRGWARKRETIYVKKLGYKLK